MHIVEKIVEDLKAGRKDHEDFWIKMGDKYVFIRYFAVRNKEGEFLGIIEVTQDIAPIQKLQVKNAFFRKNNCIEDMTGFPLLEYIRSWKAFILNDYPKRRNYPEDLLFKVNLR